LGFESLESREVLSGIVEVAVSTGVLTLTGDQPLIEGGRDQPSDNSVLVEQGAAVGQFIVSGQDGTYLRASGSLMSSVTVNGVISISVDLGLLNDTFKLKGDDIPGAGTQPASPPGNPALIRGSVVIVNGECGVKTNETDNTVIKGDLIIEKEPGVYCSSVLKVYDTTIEGNLFVDNRNGGGGGSTSTTLHRVHIEQQLIIRNSFDLDIVDIEDCWIDVATAAGTRIINGPGGSRTTFTSNGTIGNILFGSLTIRNGSNPIDVPGLPLLDDLTTFNKTEVRGAVSIDNDGGDSRVAVLDGSLLGTNVNAAGQVTVLNAAGVDLFDMNESAARFGLYIDNAYNDTDDLRDMYGSTTTITRSELGCCLLEDGQEALVVLGDDAQDIVEITECLPPWPFPSVKATIVGWVIIKLFDGNNRVVIEECDPIQGLIIQTGSGMDTVIIRGASETARQVLYMPTIELGDLNDYLLMEHVEIIGDATLDGGDGALDKLEKVLDVVFSGGVLNQINWEIVLD
jgi:hypothetical protein